MNIKLFTHTDLDGVGCYLATKVAINVEVEVEFCDYHNVNEKVKSYLEEAEKGEVSHDLVMITDISVDVLNAEKITTLLKEKKLKQVQLLDHHKTAEWLNSYDWALVESHINENKKQCGTMMVCDYFFKQLLYTPTVDKALHEFAENVRRYDTWEWHDVYYDEQPKELNDLLSIYGRDDFLRRFEEWINNHHYSRQGKVPMFNSRDYFALELRRKEVEHYVQSKNKTLSVYEINDRQVGIVFAEKHASILGNELCKLNPHIDLIAIINMHYQTISYRTVKEDVDVSAFAKQFGGGGHPKASGSQLAPILIDEFINKAFTRR